MATAAGGGAGASAGGGGPEATKAGAGAALTQALAPVADSVVGRGVYCWLIIANESPRRITPPAAGAGRSEFWPDATAVALPPSVRAVLQAASAAVTASARTAVTELRRIGLSIAIGRARALSMVATGEASGRSDPP